MQNLCGSSFYEKSLKVLVDCKNAPRNWEKVFCFWENCIWIGIVKLSLLRTWYISSAANVLTRSSEIWHVKKRDFLKLIDLAVINKYDKDVVMQISIVVRHVYRVASERVLSNGTFESFIWLRFRSPYFENYKIYEGIFFVKMFKISSRFQKCSKKWRKSFFCRR